MLANGGHSLPSLCGLLNLHPTPPLSFSQIFDVKEAFANNEKAKLYINPSQVSLDQVNSVHLHFSLSPFAFLQRPTASAPFIQSETKVGNHKPNSEMMN